MHQKIRFLLSTCLMMAALTMTLTFTACNDDEVITPPTPPVDYDQLVERAIDEFFSFAQNPRPSFHVDAPREYLRAYAAKQGWSWERDEYGNCWMDVPATSGMEDAPKVILQGHTDMVPAVADGLTLDPLKEVGTPVREGNFIYGQNMNLGADDGVGTGIILALSTSDIPHGPLRLLFTADEEPGMYGTAALDYKRAVDADYLINIDGEEEGVMFIGCAGACIFEFHKHLDRATDANGLTKLNISLRGLLGGHSGVDINKHRLSGFAVLRDIVKEVVVPHAAHLISLDCGTANNAISPFVEMSLAVKSDEVADVEAQINSMLDTYAAAFPEEQMKRNFTTSEVEADDYLCATNFNPTLSETLHNMVQGVVEIRQEDDHVTKSNNMGMTMLQNGDLQFNGYMRSDFQDWLDAEMVRYSDLARDNAFELKIATSYPSWNGDPDNALQLMMEDKWGELIGRKVDRVFCQGGVELTYFSKYRPGMQIVSMGAELTECHTINETVHINTIKPVLQSVAYVLEHVRELAR